MSYTKQHNLCHHISCIHITVSEILVIHFHQWILVVSHTCSYTIKLNLNMNFFLQIARCFPLLRKLNVNNSEPQSQMRDNLVHNNSEFYPTVEYPNLISLCLQFSCIDYYDQFLNERKTYLPHLTKLTVEYYELSFVTKNFTRKRTRCNCTKITELNLDTIIVHSKDFYDYFPLL
jgi:hypothetical protein